MLVPSVKPYSFDGSTPRPMFQQSTPSRLALLALLCGVAGLPRTVRAQAYTPPPPPLTAAPCKPTKKDPCTTAGAPAPAPAADDKFAFPGEAKDAGTLPLPSAPDSSSEAPAAPSPAGPAPAAPAGKPAANDSGFPFPGEPPETKSSGSSSSSSSSSPDTPNPGEPAASPLKDEGSSGSTVVSRRRKLAKVEDPDAREDKDLEVSRFYLASGNFIGAYNRAKDAVRLYPDDAEAHFALAAAAQKLKKNDEAVTEYTAYLKLDPGGDHDKVARHALTEIH